jgi:hypothetical protein
MEKLQQVLDLVPKQDPSIFIAGGAVVNPDLAMDIDLWIGKDDNVLAGQVVLSLPYNMYGGTNGTDYHENSTFIGQGYHPQLGLIQVIQHKWDNALDLMDTFDISTHQWAFTSTGELVIGRNATGPNDPVQILKWRAKTLERYIKICKRYGREIDFDLLAKYTVSAKNLISIDTETSFDDDIPF